MRIQVANLTLDYAGIELTDQTHSYEARLLKYVLGLQSTKNQIQQSLEDKLQQIIDIKMKIGRSSTTTRTTNIIE